MGELSKSNIVLVGMPGAGKSTVGRILAKRIGLAFVDTDDLIRSEEGRELQDIIDSRGLAAFGKIEEKVLTSLDTAETVVATGGSAVYSEGGMEALKRNGTAVYLELPLDELESRIRNMKTRGLVIPPGASLVDLCRERLPLYRRHADIVIDCRNLSAEQAAEAILSALTSFRPDPPPR